MSRKADRLLFGFLLKEDGPIFTMVLQIAFYAFAIIVYVWQNKDKPPRIAGIPFSFCLVNLAAHVGVARFLMGKKAERWEPVR